MENTAKAKPYMVFSEEEHVSRPPEALKASYDVIVIGSGYGGAVVASRIAGQTGVRVALLEKGAEWRPGEFSGPFRNSKCPAEPFDMEFSSSLPTAGVSFLRGPLTLFLKTFWGSWSKLACPLLNLYCMGDAGVIFGSGLGGGSLINSGVFLDAPRAVRESHAWPKALRSDFKSGKMRMFSERVVATVQPRPVPNQWRQAPRSKAFHRGAEELKQGGRFSSVEVTHPPLSIEFAGDSACNGCGNCNLGCNVGAKKSTDLIHLRRAVDDGAELFTRVSVERIEPTGHPGRRWKVFYRSSETTSTTDASFVLADVVILSGGPLGSTGILLRSSPRLPLSGSLGACFRGNSGGVSGLIGMPSNTWSWDIRNQRCKTTRDLEQRPEFSPGPSISTMLEVTDKHSDAVAHIMDAVIPQPLSIGIYGAVACCVGLGVLPASALNLRRLRAQTLVLNTTASGPQPTGGRLYLGPHGTVEVDTDGECRVNSEQSFGFMDVVRRAMAAAFGATLSSYEQLFPRLRVFAHVFGGCAMGEDADGGVVDHAGRVFNPAAAAPGAVHEGLWVCDSSTFPLATGRNPALLISALAERSAEAIVRELLETQHTACGPEDVSEGRQAGLVHIHRTAPSSAPSAEAKREPPCAPTAVEFSCHEVMRGELDGAPFEADVTMLVRNLGRLWRDPSSACGLVGTIECASIGPGRMPISQGVFKLVDDGEGMGWQLSFTVNQPGNPVLQLRGRKQLRGLRWMPWRWMAALTNIDIEVSGHLGGAPVLRRGRIGLRIGGLCRMLVSQGSPAAGRLLPLRLLNVLRYAQNAETFHLSTSRGRPVRLVRLCGGSKGAVVLFSGLSTSAIATFASPAQPVNLSEFLCRSGFDVFLADGGFCGDFDAVPEDLETHAQEVWPAVIANTRRIAGRDKVMVLAHCMSAVSLSMAIRSGSVPTSHFDGIIYHNGGPITKSGLWNWTKALLRIGTLFVDWMGITWFNVGDFTPAGCPRVPRWSFGALGMLMKGCATLLRRGRCACGGAAACARAEFVFGRLWHHEHLTAEMHALVPRMFGRIHCDYLNHTLRCIRHGFPVTTQGRDEYSACDWKLCSIPSLVMYGADSGVWDARQCCNIAPLLANAKVPGRAAVDANKDLKTWLVPRYGHLDTLLGQRAHEDVFPTITGQLLAWSAA